MANMTQCDEGHYYDKALNPRGCPHCGVGPVDPVRPAARPAAGTGDDRTVAAASSGGKAAPARAGSQQREGDITVAVWRRESGIDPVVGWLVCFEGNNQGRDYRILSGRNVIGRDLSSQICIAGDETISGLNHARIFFDPRNLTFHVTEGDGRSGVYVNGNVVLQPTQLQPYDVLELGRTKLVFVPLCGDRFRWDKKAEPSQPEAKPEAGREGRPPIG
jgi:hypothetical protein